MESQCENEGWPDLKRRLFAGGNPGGLWLENLLTHFLSPQHNSERCLWAESKRGFAYVSVIWRMFCFCSLGLTCEFIGFQLIGAALSLDNYPSTSKHLDLFLTFQLNLRSSNCVTPVLLNHSASVWNQHRMWGSLKGPEIKQGDWYLNMDGVTSEPPFLHL